MRILFVTSELAPFAKTGGLGDVSAALPVALHQRGHDVRPFLPLYARCRAPGREFTPVPRLSGLEVRLGWRRLRFSIFTAPIPDSKLDAWFVHCPELYDRPGIYTQDADEHVRFALLGWAALVACQHTGFAPDIAHVNDWQTALVPVTLRTLLAWDRLFARTRTVLTLHNIGYQGSFAAGVLEELGLGPAAPEFHQEQLAAGHLSFLVTGLLHAHALTTVSPTYAREIQTPEHGVGLDGLLRARAGTLFGILNGIGDEWDPATDAHLPARFSRDELAGKAVCRAALLAEVGLAPAPDAPVIGVVSRLAWQKGFDLCADALPALLARRDCRLVVLGSGERKYEELFHRLAARHPERVAFKNGFSEALAHRIEAGADLFLMPSRYEPCGLNQLYSLRYGTVPIVHRTGGLADTVQDLDARSGRGNGFSFGRFDAGALLATLDRAVTCWHEARGVGFGPWRDLMRRGMGVDHSWRARVAEYEALYRSLAG